MTAALEPGSVFADKYRIDGVLGRGGMGSVYAATNLSVGRRVAIKVMDTGNVDPETREQLVHRFRLEAQAAALIDHPGIVDVLDMGETADGSPFIVMEWLEGATLKAVGKQLGTLTPGQALAVIAPVLDALHAAHAAGVIHRDIKPANIFLCTRPRRAVKVLDFGISRFGEGSGLTQTGVSMGTPQYMAPEQVRGERTVGPESDLYSVGAMLYHLLTGRPPFDADSDMATLARVLTDQHVPLQSVRGELPPSWCKLVDRLLAKDQASRPNDALEVKRILSATAAVDETGVWEAALSAVKVELAKGTPRPGGSSKRSAPGVLAMPGGRTPSLKATPAAVRPKGVTPEPGETRAERTPKRPLALYVAIPALLVVAGVGTFLALSSSKQQPEEAPPPKIVTQDPPKNDPPKNPVAADTPAPIDIKISAEPAESRFVVDGESLDCNPCTLKRDPGAKAQVKATADKHVASEFELVFDKPREQHIALAPVADTAVANPVKKPPLTKKGKGLTVDENNPYQ